MQIKAVSFVFISIVFILLGACSEQEKETDQKEIDQKVQQEIETARIAGGVLYDNYCASCHRGLMAKAPRLAALKMLSKDAIIATLQTGVMASIAARFTKEQHAQIATFISAQSAPLSTVVAGKCDALEIEDLQQSAKSISDWGMGLENLRYIDNQQINAKNIAQLKLSWVFAFPYASRARVQPTIVGNTLFTASQDGTIYALDRLTGCIRWTIKADAEIRSAITIGYDENNQANRLYFSDFSSHVYAVDLNTKQRLWKVKVDDHPVTTITGSLSLYKNRLFVPVSSLEIVSALDTEYECCTFRGSVVALNATDGTEIWKTYTIDETPKQHGTNKIGVPIIAPSGAPVWSRPTIDTARQVLYVGTGENYTRPTSDRSDAIIAMSLENGEIQWVHQAIPKDAWNGACSIPNHPNCPENTGPDADFGAPPMLVKSGQKDLIIAGQKSGMVYALDPDNKGTVVWQQLVGRGGIMGGVHWGMATNGETLYVPINDRGTYPLHEDKTPSPGLHALQVANGKPIWSTLEKDRCEEGVDWSCGPGLSGAITATPNLIFGGALDGVLKAYDTQTGKELWAYNTNRTFESVNGVPAYGGSIDSDGAVLIDKQLFITSGYAKFNYKAGNVLLAFEVQ